MSEPSERMPGFTAGYSIEKKSRLIQLLKEDKRIGLSGTSAGARSYVLPQQLTDDAGISQEDENTNGELGGYSTESHGENECYTGESGVEICP